MRSLKKGLFGAVLAAAATQVNAGSVDAKLLDMLLANGSITQAQHGELMGDLKREERKQARADRQKVDRKEFNAYQQVAGWAATTKLTGDMRVRNDYINIEDEPTYVVPPPSAGEGRDKHRQRIRARLAAITQVNPQVEVGMQIATGNSADRRSTNQDIDNYYDKKPVWLDLGYIDYHPIQVPGLKLFAGKMKQPWMALGDAAWDGDINPEGVAASYQRKTGTTTYFGSTSFTILKDNVDGDGVQYSNDLDMLSAQMGLAFDASDSIRLTLGTSLYDFDNEDQTSPITSIPTPGVIPPANPAVALRANGNTTDQFRLIEWFGQMDVIGLPIPLTLYGQWIRNIEARDLTFATIAGTPPVTTTTTFTDGDEDSAYLMGLRTNIAGIAFDYNYRDVERNGVVGSLTDSDFAAGYTGSKGHKLKAGYDFLKNFNLTVSWFLAESDAASRFNDEDAEVDTLMIDLNAKF